MSIHFFPVNCGPLSVSIALGYPHLEKISLSTILMIVGASEELKENASIHRENKSVVTEMNFFSHPVRE